MSVAFLEDGETYAFLFSLVQRGLKIEQREFASSSLRDFNNPPGIAFRPVALYGGMSMSSLTTSFLLTTIGLKLGWLAGFSFDGVVVSSTMNTEETGHSE